MRGRARIEGEGKGEYLFFLNIKKKVMEGFNIWGKERRERERENNC